MHGILEKTNAFVAGVCNNFQSAKPNNISNSEMHQTVEAVSNSNSMTLEDPLLCIHLQQTIHLMIIMTKSWVTLDTCEFSYALTRLFLRT